MLTSHVKGVKNGYPLKVLAKQVIVNSIEFNAEFIARMIPKVDWSVLRTTAQSVSGGNGLLHNTGIAKDNSVSVVAWGRGCQRTTVNRGEWLVAW